MLEMKSLQLDTIKKAVELNGLIQEIKPVLEEIAGVSIPALPAGVAARVESLKDQGVEAAVELNGLSPSGATFIEYTTPSVGWR